MPKSTRKRFPSPLHAFVHASNADRKLDGHNIESSGERCLTMMRRDQMFDAADDFYGKFTFMGFGCFASFGVKFRFGSYFLA